MSPPTRRFRKTAPAAQRARFEAEIDGLAALRATRAVRVPDAYGIGETPTGEVWVELEFLELRGLNERAGTRLGEQLAALHRQTGMEADAAYGWPRDNFIGASVQSNRSHASWPAFFAAERLLPQLHLARGNGMASPLIELGERLAASLAAFFPGYHPLPSLLHGDLWSGNAGRLPDGTPVIFDPAVHRGDRETDLAMTELFGGFPASFYAAYRAAWPLDPGYETRKTLYNLYHVLNHFNLFGSSYLGQARRMIERLIAELKG